MDAARAYVKAAISYLAAAGERGTPDFYERWTKIGERAYLRQHGEQISYNGFRLKDAELHGLPEYARALSALEQDAVIAPQLDQLVGDSTGAHRIEKDRILDGLAAATTRGRELTFDEESFANAYLSREAELYSATVAHLVIAPVAGLAQAPDSSFGDVELAHLAQVEADALLNHGGLLGSSASGIVYASTDYVLRHRLELPKVLGRQEDLAPAPDRAPDFLNILAAFRLLKSDPVSLPTRMTLSEFGGMTFTWQQLAPLPPIKHPTYTLTPAEAAELAALWEQLRHPAVQKRKHLLTAIRRFGYAGERTRIEDRFIDLMIAAEAMFFGESQETEITYKISMRFAQLEIPGTTKRERFDHMKTAYDARSKIVHGNRPKRFKSDAELADFTERTAMYLRHDLREMLNGAQKSPDAKDLFEWDDLIVGAASAAVVDEEDEAGEPESG